MARYALKIEYHGARFFGWQRQKTHPSVQQTVEEALAKIEPVPVIIEGAGRTDTGVHALGQVAHCDLQKDWTSAKLCAAMNYHLRPYRVVIKAAARVADDFHARFSAIERRYMFRLLTARMPSVFDAGLVWQIPHALDAEAMQLGANHLLGSHDFTTFRSAMCQAGSAVKTLDKLDISVMPRAEDAVEYRFDVRARSFLHHQVRSFVGTLARVGEGAWSPDRVKTALEACDRAQCGPVCPPQGLYLAEVCYGEEVFKDV